MPGRKFTSPQGFNKQLIEWLPIINAHTPRSIHGRLVDRRTVDVKAMTVLPSMPPASLFSHRVRISRDYYVGLDRNDYQ